jgi:hypothetical protein
LLWWLFGKIHPQLGYFLPLQSADSLIIFPNMEKLMTNMPAQSVMLIATLAFSSLYIWLTVRKYKYDDL